MRKWIVSVPAITGIFSGMTVFSATSVAQDAYPQNFYGTLGALAIEAGYDTTSDSTNFTGLSMGFGKRLAPWASVEARFITSVGGGKIDSPFASEDVTVKINHLAGIFGKFNHPRDGALTPYGLVGYSTSEATIKQEFGPSNLRESGMTFGLGLDACKGTYCFNAELTRYLDYNGGELDALSISAVFTIL